MDEHHRVSAGVSDLDAASCQGLVEEALPFIYYYTTVSAVSFKQLPESTGTIYTSHSIDNHPPTASQKRPDRFASHDFFETVALPNCAAHLTPRD